MSICFVLIYGSCTNTTNKDQKEFWISEVRDVEMQFNKMAKEQGTTAAFYHFAAENAAMKKGRTIVKGRDNIRTWYEKDYREGDLLQWKPTFIDISNSGDLAYTYGDYTFSYLDTTGLKKVSHGIFHTVWKKQSDGQWKFVWD